jgi:valyl-tRNA synthetase
MARVPQLFVMGIESMEDSTQFTYKLVNAIEVLKLNCREVIDYAEAKQRQRAEPWQQTIIDRLNKALKNYEDVMKDVEDGH